VDPATNTEQHQPSSQAQGTGTEQASPSYVTKDDLTQLQNSMFANMRKMVEGIVSKAPVSQEPQAKAKTPESSSNPDVVTRDELSKTLERRDSFHRAARNFRLSDGALSRMQRDFERDRPEDAATWVQAYVSDFGLAGGTETKPPATPRSGPPASDGGAPAPVTVPSDEIEPWRLSESDVAALIRRDGFVAAGAQLRKQFRSSLSGRRLRLTR
jgi:hypothetical protein